MKTKLQIKALPTRYLAHVCGANGSGNNPIDYKTKPNQIADVIYITGSGGGIPMPLEIR